MVHLAIVYDSVTILELFNVYELTRKFTAIIFHDFETPLHRGYHLKPHRKRHKARSAGGREPERTESAQDFFA